MSEKKYHHHSLEHARGSDEILEPTIDKLDELVEEKSHLKHEHAERLDEIRNEINESAKNADEVMPSEDEKEPEGRPMLINKELKDMAFKRTLTRVRKELSVPERAFSKVVHNSKVEAVSNVGAKTVARPSGLLAGGVFAFIGSSTFLWLCKHYGYEYNFLLFAIFFVGGFFLGLILELFWRILRREKA